MSSAVKTFPELSRSVYLAYDEGIEHYDQEVGDQLNEDELGPEDVVRDVFLKVGEKRVMCQLINVRSLGGHCGRQKRGRKMAFIKVRAFRRAITIK